MSITVETYTSLQQAYDYFNRSIFEDKLPECLITLPYSRGAYGHFRDKPFNTRNAKKAKHADEIALNPFTFSGRTDREILSTLVHEMCHLWQHHFGKPKKTHHDREWAAKMESVGLMPSSTGEEGGRRTGRRVSHYIIAGGVFDKAERKCGVKINWAGLMREDDKKARKRTKYCCPKCDINAYGKSGLNLVCADCDEAMEEA